VLLRAGPLHRLQLTTKRRRAGGGALRASPLRAGTTTFGRSCRLLLLFDIDGTLVRGRPLTHQLALEEAASAVFGLDVPPGSTPVADVEPWGKTDRQILRDVLARAGLPEPDDESLARWERAACEAYERLEVGDGAGDHAATAEALARLRDAGHLLALLTGNLEPIARRKLALRGLGDFFPSGQGGFGSDAELRPDLVPIARARAGGVPPSETVLIGDTPLDVAAALADGVRAIAITGHRFSADELLEAGASATVDELAELEAAFAAL
jgi:phosphoglycolate phosphatase